MLVSTAILNVPGPLISTKLPMALDDIVLTDAPLLTRPI